MACGSYAERRKIIGQAVKGQISPRQAIQQTVETVKTDFNRIRVLTSRRNVL